MSQKMNTFIRAGLALIGVLALSMVLSGGPVQGENEIIRTIAGTGMGGFSGDGGPAVQAELNTMQGLAIDAQGNLYIAEPTNQVVRKVDAATGIISRIAGLGPNRAGFNGDRQPALEAMLASPTDVVADAQGNLYIADNGNHRIRRIDRNGIITTVAGTGEPGFSGDGGLATAARLMNPSALALDVEGNLYIADVGNNRIRRVDRATGIITTVAGSGARGFAGDGGPATAAAFNGLRGLAIGPGGDLFVADFFNQRVRRISADGTITTVAGNGTFNISNEQQLGDGGPATQAVVRWPIDVAVDQVGNLYIAENASHRIRRVTPDGIITTVVGSGSPLFGGFSGDGGPARQARLNLPSGIAVDGLGNLYISDAGNFRVRKVSPR